MKYHSLNKKAPDTTFREAVIRGIAPDKGLYFPEEITPLPDSFFKNIDSLSYEAIAYEAIKQFVTPDIPKDIVKKIISEN